MARRLFHVPQVRRETAELEGEMAQHLVRVLRMEVGQVFEISDNEALYLAEVETARKSQVVFRVKEELPTPPEQPPITLLPAVFKFDHFEWMLEKATELGVTTLQPVFSERTERGLDKAAEKRMERWRRILLEASQQCRRMRLPEILEPMDLEELPATTTGLLLDELPGGETLLARLTAQADGPVPPMLLGPEGGWAERERQWLVQQGWKRTTLGPLILRAETAAIAALSCARLLRPAGAL